MKSVWISLAVFLTGCLDFGEGVKFLLTVPKEPHYDSEYTATVSALGVTNREKVSLDLEYRGVRDRSQLLNSTTLTFKDNLVQTWTVVFPWSRMHELGEESVTLSMSTLYEQKRVTLKFSQETGYIFIQTDKPLYSPRQTVKFRIIAVDEYQRLAKYPLKVDVKNEKLVVVDRMRYTAEDAFQGQEFELPRETPPGNWTITANFEGPKNAPSTSQSVTFEVKEYVLPRFSANVEISTDVITNDTRWITITASAKYVYGRLVAGMAEMQLGVWDPIKGLKLLPTVYKDKLKEGKFTQNVRVLKIIPRDYFLEGEHKRLYVSVNITEDGTQEVDRLEDTTTFIAHPFYNIRHDLSKSHFKPGFPYTLVSQINAKSGRAASWLKVWTDAQFKGENGRVVLRKTGYYDLDSEGMMRVDFDVPENAKNITFKTVVLDFTAGFNNDRTFTVQQLPSANNQYLHISMVKPIKKRSDGLLKLRYTRLEDADGFRLRFTRDVITILVISKGHLVYTTNVVRNSDGLNNIGLPSSLYAETSPFMRIVAFYHYNGTKPEYVSDSIKIYTDHACVEELSLTKDGGLFASTIAKKPKQNYKLQVRGGPKMKVGFVAVDKAVLLLNDRHTLTRDSMFEELGTHDLGEGIGDGQTIETVLESSGLTHMTLDTNKEKGASYEPLVGSNRDKYIVDQRRNTGMPIHIRQTDDTRVHGLRKGRGPAITEEIPPQTIRKYFPESWLFENHVLSMKGRLKLNTTLPDSITTWSFMAVGISSTRGICVSNRLEQQVQRLLFVDVRMPYKATRLEVVNVKIAVYNYYTYDVLAKITVTGEEGICFSDNTMRGSRQNTTNFSAKIGGQKSKSYIVKVIPLRNGDLTLRVDVSTQNDRDIVEKKLYVVAEGLRVRKSLTFVLDPEAKHATFKPRKRNRITMINTGMVNNHIDTRRKTQRTRVDLSMPREVIRGTEFCRVSAFGDLMGDIINHAVVKSKSLMEHGVQDAEEVIGDLGPTVHAILYANKSGLMNEELQKKGKRFIKHGIARLLKYRTDSAFNLLPGSEKSTWLTAIVLKTLCHAASLTFIDKASLIDDGFYWLLSQVKKDGVLIERDWRLAEDSLDYKVMLSAEVLIALQECDRNADEHILELQGKLAFYLEDIYPKIVKPMVLAKVAYALTLFDDQGEATINVIKMLDRLKRRNNLGQYYWGDRVETNERRSMPFWYHKGAKASSIEATAYALLVYLQNRDRRIDAIADWLVAQRNDHGAFVGAMDSIAAIQALSSYSLQKQRVKVDLSCNVSFDRHNEFSHSFKFTEKNAIRPELLSNIPVGQTIEVLTKGQGLGQMQVNIEYNIPYDKNENCPFNVTIEVKNTQVKFFPGMENYPLCTYCDINCPEPEPEVNETDVNCTLYNSTMMENFTNCLNESNENITTTTPTTKSLKTDEDKVQISPKLRTLRPERQLRLNTARPELPVRRKTPLQEFPTRRKIVPARRRQRRPGLPSVRRPKLRKTSKRRSRQQKRRRERSVRNQPSASRRSICVHICLQHLRSGAAGETRIEVEMLSGYFPVKDDIAQMVNSHMVKSAAYNEEKRVIVAVFKKVSDEERTCIVFRAVDEEEVGRPTPASVLITEIEEQDPSCVLQYHPPLGQESLQVYCADFSHINRGECRCYSGICSSCAPKSLSQNEIQLHQASQMVCNSHIGYQVQVTKIQDRDQWLEINARVLSLNKTGSHQLKPNEHITLITPSSCSCPTFYNINREPLYMLSSDVEKMVDRRGRHVHRYILDENSKFLRVAKPRETVSRVPSVPHWYLQQAFSPGNKCFN